MEAKDEIKQRLDIADVISGYLTIKPAGSGSFKALCPFHSEKSPSFHISRERQIWHCFGCNQGGDIFSFVRQIEGLDFPEALRLLGTKAGVVVPEFTPNRVSSEDSLLRELNELAGKFFEKILLDHPEGQAARDYLIKRQLSGEPAATFRLGAAPDRWDALVTFLLSRGFSPDKIAKAGLAKPRSTGSGLIDRFRNRLMIPLCDYSGRIVGFTGRYLGEIDEKSGPKYLNSPETAIYHKSDQLYGLHLAKSAIRLQGSVIVMEGNLDVIASHKANVKNCIASSGTALTESQLRQLKKLTSKLVFCFDGDNAGFLAAKRGIHLAQGLDFEVRVIAIPPELGKDPDDVVRQDPDAWVKLSQHPIHIVDYYFREALARFNPSKVEDKRELAKLLTEEIRLLNSPIEREHWLQALADVIHVSLETLRPMAEPTPNKVVVPIAKVGSKTVSTVDTYFGSKIDRASAYIFGVLLVRPELSDDVVARVNVDLLSPNWGSLYKRAVLAYTARQTTDSTPTTFFSRLLAQLASDGSQDEINRLNAVSIWIERLVQGQSPETLRAELSHHIALLDAYSHEQQRQQLESAIRQAEATGETEKLRILLEQYSKLLKSA
jgi:DNA primase